LKEISCNPEFIRKAGLVILSLKKGKGEVESQLQIGKDMRVKLQTSPSVQLNLRGDEKKLRPEGDFRIELNSYQLPLSI